MDDFSKGNGGRRVYRPGGSSSKGVTSTLGTTYSGRDDMPQGNRDGGNRSRNPRDNRDDGEPRRRHNFERKQRVQDEASQALSGAVGLSDAERESLEIMRESAPRARRVEKKEENLAPVKVGEGGPLLTHLKQLRQMSTDELFQLAEELNVKDSANLRRHEMMFRIVEAMPKDIEVHGEGVMEILSDGFGFLRMADNNYTAWPEDIYVSPGLIRRLGLRNGDTVQGTVRYPNPGERYFALVRVDKLNGKNPEDLRHRPNFDKLTPLYPTEKFTLETAESKDRTGQVIDLVAPIGKGQRCMLVAPPKAGKTMMMKAVAHAIEDKHPEVTLIVLLIDERPEEVTDMQRSVKGEVVSSTFDEPANRHCQVAEMVIEKAKRLVEMGQDVVILLDSLTRLARAYNTMMPSSGKVLTGGLDANAMQRPKRFFGAARKIEEGGSLTIIATALIDTGSRMDEVIFEEFKGTGNSEIWLERKLVEKRVYPAIDISKSGTRHEELLFGEDELQKIWILRRILNPMGTVESMEFLIDKMRRAKTNAEFFKFMSQ